MAPERPEAGADDKDGQNHMQQACVGATRRVGTYSLVRNVILTSALALSLTGCLGYDGEVHRGYMVDEKTISQVKPSMPAEKVLELLGDPSTTSTVGGGAWYYISQTVDASFAFIRPSVTDQHVLAIYFDKDRKVERLANYGMQDGKVFDFISRTTPTGGAEQSFVANLFRSFGRF
jgi:outer membrane protein assembly factor BamE (lipoprotein component of BamABCDE complex)